MKVRIDMLDVKDGDSIFVELIKTEQNKRLVLVIDGGKSTFYTEKVKPKFEEIITNNELQTKIIVVCTHFDSDHIGSLIPLVREYINYIDEVWVYKTPAILETYFESANSILNESTTHILGFESFNIQHLFEGFQTSEKSLLNEWIFRRSCPLYRRC